MADYRFRVSDSYLIPLRGWMLRLKLLEGDFDPSTLRPGSTLRLTSPDGIERTVTVRGLSTTGGRQRQARIDAYREFDIVIPETDGFRDDRRIDAGWEATPQS